MLLGDFITACTAQQTNIGAGTECLVLNSQGEEIRVKSVTVKKWPTLPGNVTADRRVTRGHTGYYIVISI